MFKTIFFDAAGTLFHLPKGVGHHYALVGTRLGLELDATALDRAFAISWEQMPARPAIDGPREDDDKGWWRELVNQVIDQVAPAMHELDRDAFFEVAYSHFAEAGVWELYPRSSRCSKRSNRVFARGDFKFRRTPARDPGTVRRREVFSLDLRFQRARRGQT